MPENFEKARKSAKTMRMIFFSFMPFRERTCVKEQKHTLPLKYFCEKKNVCKDFLENEISRSQKPESATNNVKSEVENFKRKVIIFKIKISFLLLIFYMEHFFP